jgi:hypothetical protein
MMKKCWQSTTHGILALLMPLVLAGCSGLADFVEGQQPAPMATLQPIITPQEVKPLCVIISAYMNYYQKNFNREELEVIGSVLSKVDESLRDNRGIDVNGVLILSALKFYFGHVGVPVKISPDEKFNTLLALEAARSIAQHDGRLQFIAARLGDVLKGLQDAEAKGATTAKIIDLSAAK